MEELATQIGALSAHLSSDDRIAMLAVSTLFARVARSLARLEEALANVEGTTAPFLFRESYGALLSTPEFQAAAAERLLLAFQTMKEAAAVSQNVIRGVLAHPVYGLGPSPAGLRQAQRNDLARAAGLNHRELALLEDRPG